VVEERGAVVLEVFRLGASGFSRKMQWLAFIGLEVLGHGRVSEGVA
jgi:hypothetical protein